MSESTQRWEYATVPLLVHATKQILDTWGVRTAGSWCTVVPGPERRTAGRLPQAAGVTAAARRRLAGAAGRARHPAARRSRPPVAAYVPGGADRHPGVHLRPAADRRRRAATGKVGAEVIPSRGQGAAAVCALNALAAIDALVGLDSVVRGRQGGRLRGQRARASPASRA